MKNKVDKVRKKIYIEPGIVLRITHMFCVCKGLNNIWMVYNVISCGLNLYIWAQYFVLPIFQHTIRALLLGYSQ